MPAYSDMRGNLILAAVVLLLGALYVFSRRGPAGAKPARNWIPIVSLFAGPAIVSVWWAAEVFVFSPDSYLVKEDAWALLPPLLVIGTFVGFVASAVFGMVSRVRRSSGD